MHPAIHDSGVEMGYPSCCIEHFDHIMGQGGSPAMFAEAHYPGRWNDDFPGTGFIPCPTCAKTIEAMGLARFAAQVIMPKRQYRLPFPVTESNAGLYPPSELYLFVADISAAMREQASHQVLT